MISAEQFEAIVAALGEQGQHDINWSIGCGMPLSAEAMAEEIIFVIANSGMRNTVARLIYDRVIEAISLNRSAHTAFDHKGKASAMDHVWSERGRLFAELCKVEGSEALLEWCVALPWIGGITKYHVAKNFGANVAKPDVHLQRLADREGVTPQELCARLSLECGHRIATVDVLLWRACANGIINSKTGEIRSVVA